MEEVKKKRKKPSLWANIFIAIILASIISLLAVLKFGDEMYDMGVDSWYIFLATLIFTLILEFIAGSDLLEKYAKRYNMFHKRLFAFFKLSFFYVIIPFMFLTPALLGAVHTKYPYESNFTISVEKNFDMAGEAMSDGFQKLVSKSHTLGTDRPNFMIWIIIIFFIVATYQAFRQSKDDVYEDMEAQELIDTLTEKDYKDPPKSMFDGLFKKKLKEKTT